MLPAFSDGFYSVPLVRIKLIVAIQNLTYPRIAFTGENSRTQEC
jgi:hypothetical protein